MAVNMNKETKIGLAVLLTLFLTLGAVVTWRFMRPGETAATADDADENKGQAKANADKLDRDADKPDLFTAKATRLSPAANPSRLPPDDTSRWTAARDPSGRSATHGSAAAGASSPSTYMPNAMPVAPAGSPDDRYAMPGHPRRMEAGSSQVTRVEVSADGAPDRLTGGVSRDPGERYSGVATPVGQGAGSVRVLDPPAISPGYGQNLPPAPTSAYAQNSRFSRPPAGQPAGTQMPSLNRPMPLTPAAPVRASETGYASIGGSQSVAENPRRDDGTYEVQPNDNFWTISQRLYGTGAYFKALAQHNRGKVPRIDRLDAGSLIAAPTIAQLEQQYPDLCPKPGRRDATQSRAAGVRTAGLYAGGRTYVVQEGDTLFRIARSELGKVQRWGEIYELNREVLGKDYHYLTPGMQLVLPSKDALEPVERTARGTGGYQR